MKFTKPALSTEQQADLLISRGMQGDRAEMIRRLTAVSYYTLSGYWHTYRPTAEPTTMALQQASAYYRTPDTADLIPAQQNCPNPDPLSQLMER